MFGKILVANRGEIAVRVMRTARRMGLATVAVYSEADAGALHVEMADEAIAIGPAPASESYLVIEAILDACRRTGADAVHPGYGFLSEREAFATALAEAGVAFIGPPPAAIAAMGDKIESKRLAREAGVHVVPGFVGEIGDADHAARIAAEIGYPVMVKASAGGGGKGMRLAFSERELRESFVSVRNEARASFGDDRLFIERFIQEPRHIEIQLLGDQHGNIVHLFERDCSIQRRHQKVIEESPSPFVTPDMRAEMGRQAVELARRVGYYSAGTVEFIAGADRSFYFLEMNTRLQVEHPVTEMVTGLDLVEWMIRIAAGERLPFGQDELCQSGHAIETRIYAEDPYRGFLPSIGRLTRFQPPPLDEASVRLDTGVVEGSEISMFYDPMIAKLITHAGDRAQAAALQLDALDRFTIRGISHNADFLAALMAHPRFLDGSSVTTGFIAEEYPEGFAGAVLDEATIDRLAAVLAAAGATDRARAFAIDGQLNGPPSTDSVALVVELDRQQHRFEVGMAREAAEVTADDGRAFAVEIVSWERPGVLEARVDGQPLAAQLDPAAAGWTVVHRGRRLAARILSPRAAELVRHIPDKPAPDLSRYLLCPMPGLVVSLMVGPGDRVEPGQPLAVVEAMKMENILRAERTAIVDKVCAQPGDSLAVDAVILEFAEVG